MDEGVRHLCAADDCISSIADRFGFFWQTLWDHPENRELRDLRGEPDVLLEGDAVFIPARNPKDVQKSAEARHRFRRKGVPAEIHLRLLDEGEPRAAVAYSLEVGGRVLEGETDADGNLREFIPPGSTQAILKLIVPERTERYVLRVGRLAPVTTERGALERLKNLGCTNQDADERQLPALLLAFQRARGLEPTGKLDGSTQAALQAAHGY